MTRKVHHVEYLTDEHIEELKNGGTIEVVLEGCVDNTGKTPCIDIKYGAPKDDERTNAEVV